MTVLEFITKTQKINAKIDDGSIEPIEASK